MTQRNKLNWKERLFLAPINFQTQPLFNVDIRWQSKSHEGSLSTSRFCTAAKTLLAFISRAAWHAAPMLQHESRPLTKRMFWKVTLPSPSIFSTKDVCPISFTVSFCLYLYLQPREKCFFFKRWVTWLDIIFRDETDLVICFLSCWVKFPALEANSWRRRASLNPGNWVCVFFSLPPFLAFFSRSNAHTHTNKEGAKTRGN